MGWNRSWAPYVPVGKRRAQAARELAALNKSSKGKGKARCPVLIATHKIATTFWGEAWCKNLESYSDYSNRLPRGRSYCRNGSIVDLQISEGNIDALVCGSSLYKIKINITTLQAKTWKSIKLDCSKSIHSMMDLLRGKLSNAVMQRLTQAKIGLFPEPKEIDFKCSCPDSAYLCKHLAAVMYGIGNRLDSSPELLFVLRGVEQSELIGEIAIGATGSDSITGQAANGENDLAVDDLGSLFGIDLVSKPLEPKKRSAKKASTAKSKVVPLATLKRSTKKTPSAPIRATKKVGKKTTAAKSKVTKAKPITNGNARPPVRNSSSRPKGLPESLRQAMEKLERKTTLPTTNTAQSVTAQKRKSTPKVSVFEKSETGRKPR